jgi:iron complex outermembrane recepter protein
MSHIKNLFQVAAFLFVFSFAITAQTGGKISGKVTFGDDNTVLQGATVKIVELKKTVVSNQEGYYEFTGVPAGNYTLAVHQEGFSDTTKKVELASGVDATADFAMKLTGVREEITVTASGSEQSVLEAFQSVTSVSSALIAEKASTSIGEVLEGESGVSKRSFGTGSSRPVIRGFDGDRVLVAQDGVRSGSLASQSGDHGETVDVLSVERIEVVKGPATLLYGSSAIGGVVNAISSREDTWTKNFRGTFTALGGTNNKQAGVSGAAQYGFRKFMIFGDGSFQRTGDFIAPNYGEIPNSSTQSASGLFGAGYYTKKTYFTTEFSADKRRYGIPFAGLIESGGASNDENIDIKARTYNLKLSGGFRDIKSFVTSGKFTLNYNRYRHQELEDEDVGTLFRNESFSYRGMFEQKKFGKLTGRFGFDGLSRNYEVTGLERLIEGAVKHDSFSVFGLEELKFKRFSFQFGGRIENNRYNPDNPLLLDRSFTGFSGALGVRVALWENGSFVVNYTNSFRAAALEELYNNGPHVGTVSFEIGNQNLKNERANGIDFSLRQDSERVRAEFNVYYYRINNFIYLAYADDDADGNIDIEDNLPVARYSQGNSQYFGAEANLDVKVNKYLRAIFNADMVRAKLIDADLNLPRIPPARAKIGLDFSYKNLNVRPEINFAGAQNRLYPLERRTAGYGLVNVAANYILGKSKYAQIFSVSAYNLTNKEYRNHLSFIKDYAPEIGRGVRFSYAIRFF